MFVKEAERAGSVLRHMVAAEELSPVVLCVGSSKVVGDSLGPRVGTKLHTLCGRKVPVCGNMSNPIHALNLKDVSQKMQSKYGKRPLIVVDACVGNEDHVGGILVGAGYTIPGSGVGKKMSRLGSFYMHGIVCKNTQDLEKNYQNLFNVSESFIQELSDSIALAICYALGGRG